MIMIYRHDHEYFVALPFLPISGRMLAIRKCRGTIYNAFVDAHNTSESTVLASALEVDLP
jgi:hypothetical protein